MTNGLVANDVSLLFIAEKLIEETLKNGTNTASMLANCFLVSMGILKVCITKRIWTALNQEYQEGKNMGYQN